VKIIYKSISFNQKSFSAVAEINLNNKKTIVKKTINVKYSKHEFKFISHVIIINLYLLFYKSKAKSSKKLIH
jgi:hypothetical protein